MLGRSPRTRRGAGLQRRRARTLEGVLGAGLATLRPFLVSFADQLPDQRRQLGLHDHACLDLADVLNNKGLYHDGFLSFCELVQLRTKLSHHRRVVGHGR